MDRAQALRVEKFITSWLRPRGEEYMVKVQVVKLAHDPQTFGVRLAVDGEAYDDLYSNEGYYLGAEEAAELRGYGAKNLKVGAQGGTRNKLEADIAKFMRWSGGTHYFENVTSGIMEMY